MKRKNCIARRLYKIASAEDLVNELQNVDNRNYVIGTNSINYNYAASALFNKDECTLEINNRGLDIYYDVIRRLAAIYTYNIIIYDDDSNELPTEQTNMFGIEVTWKLYVKGKEIDTQKEKVGSISLDRLKELLNSDFSHDNVMTQYVNTLKKGMIEAATVEDFKKAGNDGWKAEHRLKKLSQVLQDPNALQFVEMK